MQRFVARLRDFLLQKSFYLLFLVFELAVFLEFVNWYYRLSTPTYDAIGHDAMKESIVYNV